MDPTEDPMEVLKNFCPKDAHDTTFSVIEWFGLWTNPVIASGTYQWIGSSGYWVISKIPELSFDFRGAMDFFKAPVIPDLEDISLKHLRLC